MVDLTTTFFDSMVLESLRGSQGKRLTVGQLWGMPIRRGLANHLEDMRSRNLVAYDNPIAMETIVSLPKEGR